MWLIKNCKIMVKFLWGGQDFYKRVNEILKGYRDVCGIKKAKLRTAMGWADRLAVG
ncbi:hypothetical protein KSX_15730 [Ktedonospora formicarum]|uniref:Uncharacterized protein n=1 Tax=Ktedonospora formicarum TaxID=2778364 RepID=A0A8J3HYE8_9CHLR|nr:hypothetical protein KSX_15730 [Ktedonospora formicarum]